MTSLLRLEGKVFVLNEINGLIYCMCFRIITTSSIYKSIDQSDINFFTRNVKCTYDFF